MTSTPPRQPIFNIPAAVLAVIVPMAAIQAARDALPDRLDAALLDHFAFVPGRLTYAVAPDRVLAAMASLDLTQEAGQRAYAVGRFFLGDGSPQPWTLLTYALLHGNWTHFGLNAVWLLAFGAPVARRFGARRFLAFLASGAIAGALAHACVDVTSLEPLVGASAAVSACMGAALRFMFHSPRPAADQPAETVPPPGRRARLSLGAMLGERRAMAFLAVWFITNFVTGVAAVPLGLSAAPIAWQAHIGGLLFGLLAFPLFDRVRAPVPAATDQEPSPGR